MGGMGLDMEGIVWWEGVRYGPYQMGGRGDIIPYNREIPPTAGMGRWWRRCNMR
jgi:hypothetical protein